MLRAEKAWYRYATVCLRQLMVVHAGGHDARLAPAPGNLLYQIGTYLYQLAIAFATTSRKAQKSFGVADRTIAACTIAQMPHCWPCLMASQWCEI